MAIKGIIFDYGGTLDTNGVHWFHIFRQAYAEFLPHITEEQLRQAYVYAERYLAKNRVIEPADDFLAMLCKKIAIQLKHLTESFGVDTDETLCAHLAERCDVHVRQTMKQTRQVLDAFAERFPMVLVSNFYGNIHSVLKEYDIIHYFRCVIESAVVGVRKPDPAIFTLGIEALGIAPHEVLVVGDSYTKDIVPAHTLGCHTAWIKGLGWESLEDPTPRHCADIVLSDLKEICDLHLPPSAKRRYVDDLQNISGGHCAQ